MDDAARTTHRTVAAQLLGRDYWLVTSEPVPGTTQDDIRGMVEAHVSWLLDLETQGIVLASGPLTSGPGVVPGSGMTVLRALDAAEASEIAAGDPFVKAGLRDFIVRGWRLNEGAVTVRLSLGAGTFEWQD